MILRRKIAQKLKEWKATPNHNPLVIKGCRQCGKTYSVIEFAKDNYAHYVYVNFFSNTDFSMAFNDMDVDKMVMYLSAILKDKADFVPYQTCIILDEIQECPKARTALKFFKLDGRYDVICTGSLLGISGYRSEPVSIPVGYETNITMYPLDFEEFMWANGVDTPIIEVVKRSIDNVTPVPEVIHNRLYDLMLQYIVVGGMPAAVVEFVTSHNMSRVSDIQRDIVSGYRDDMIKYAPKEFKSRICECFDSIPAQLAKENKKFQYSLVARRGTAEKFDGCIQWIEDAGVICRCNNLTITELPLAGNVLQGVFKVYMADIGLLTSMLEDETKVDILAGSLYGYKGAIFENLIADFFHKAGQKLYYFRKDSGMEIDFVTRMGSECVAIECKANSGNAKSLKTLLKHPEKYHVNRGIKFGNYNVGLADATLTLPLYTCPFLLR